jgi:hypothetical protein
MHGHSISTQEFGVGGECFTLVSDGERDASRIVGAV